MNNKHYLGMALVILMFVLLSLYSSFLKGLV
jgi:hypothetical protein